MPRRYRRPYMMEVVTYTASGIPHDPSHFTYSTFQEAEEACRGAKHYSRSTMLFERDKAGEWQELARSGMA